MNKKQQLIHDIQNLLNNYDDTSSTLINKDLLNFMDEKTLISIISSLLEQKEASKESDLKWLEQFKSHYKAI